MREIEKYLDEIMDAAGLAPKDATRVRRELQEHILDALEAARNCRAPEKDAIEQVKRDFGEPRQLGGMIACAKGRFRTYIKKHAAVLSVTATAAIVIFLTGVISKI
jgi:hypothetical protein